MTNVSASADLPMLLAQMDEALRQGRPGDALAWARQALAAKPENTQVRVRAAGALRRLGRDGEALDMAGAAEIPALSLERAAALRALQRHAEADAVYERLLENAPRQRWALRGYVLCARERGRPDLAMARAERALAQTPDEAGLALLLADTLQDLGRPADALARLAQAETSQEPEMAPGVAACKARALFALGRMDEAFALAEDVLIARPGHAGMRALAIRCLIAKGETVIADARIAAWRAEEPDAAPAMRLAAARCLEEMRTADARALYEELLEASPGSLGDRLLLAELCLRLGDLSAAAAHVGKARALTPDHARVQALLAELALRQEGPAAALAVLQSDIGKRSAHDAPHLIRHAEIALQAGETETARRLALALDLESLATPQLLRARRLAEGLDEDGMASEALDRIFDSPALPAGVARSLLGEIHAADETLFSDTQVEALLDRIPRADRLALGLRIEALRKGPFQALGRARARGLRAGSGRDAAAIGELIRQAGAAPLGARYLSMASMRWPGSWEILAERTRTLCACGRAKEALALLDHAAESGIGPGDPAASVLRAEILMHQGELAESLAVLDALHAVNPERAPQELRIRLAISLGRLAPAEMALADLRRLAPGRRRSRQFGPSQLGAQLVELKLLARQQARAPRDHEDFYQPAAERVAEWFDSRKPARTRAANTQIPRRVMQYWSQGEAPEDIERAIESWRQGSGGAHVRLDRRSATTFLSERYGPRHVRAFRLANHVSEEADFLRLCYLASEGGLYADADDLLVGDIEALRSAATEAVFVREPFGSIANNFIAARAGHPILAWAAERACASLLAREKDSTWTKTGPGLMTRAVAVGIEEGAAGGVAILSQQALQRVVQVHLRAAYKATPHYWDAPRQRLGRASQAVLSARAG